MSAFSEVRRAEVVDRAGYRCEYCHIPTRGQVATFPIDHVVPRSAGGEHGVENLALTCPRCNANKWTQKAVQDELTDLTVQLFHPRHDDWTEHFAWSIESFGELVGLTPTGRATVTALRINDADSIALRLFLNEVGLFPDLHS